jgi:hypothetical protein
LRTGSRDGDGTNQGAGRDQLQAIPRVPLRWLIISTHVITVLRSLSNQLGRPFEPLV